MLMLFNAMMGLTGLMPGPRRSVGAAGSFNRRAGRGYHHLHRSGGFENGTWEIAHFVMAITADDHDPAHAGAEAQTYR
jgi:hypothetical protein